jgi:hypothetical protein
VYASNFSVPHAPACDLVCTCAGEAVASAEPGETEEEVQKARGGLDSVASLMEALELEGITPTEYTDPNEVIYVYVVVCMSTYR